MSIIVNSAWKNKKNGDTVTFKGEEYTIGEDAFKSIENAVDAGNTDDLVIVDKKLSSPVKKQNITGAATDIFAAEETETESKDGKTTTWTTKFSAAAGGTASIKDEAAELNGFENVTAKNAGGAFFGGKQNVNINAKEVDDSTKNFYSYEYNSNSSSVASGSLTASGSSTEDKIEVSVGAIPEEDEKVAAGDASFANLSLTNATIIEANGGSITGKETSKYSNSKDEKITSESSQSFSRKVGSGTADLTDSNAETLKGFKTVNITASKAGVTVGDIKAGSKEDTSSSKTSFEEDKSSSITTNTKGTESVGGTVNLTGKNTEEQAVTLEGGIERAASINLKNAILDGAEIDTENGTENSSISISVKQQKDTAALTASYSGSDSSTAAGSLTAVNSIISVAAEEEDEAGAEGLKDVSISASTVNGTFDATNFKGNYTKKETGSAIDGVTADQYTYVGKFGISYDSEEGHDLVELDTELVDAEEAYSYEWTVKEETSVGGGKFQISGKTADESSFTAAGYKSVSLDNTNKEVALTAILDNSDAADTFSESGKISFQPDSSYSKTYKETESDKAVGDATITGNVSAGVSAFASVKVSGENAELTEFSGSREKNKTTDKSWTVKATKEDPIGNYSLSKNSSYKGGSSLDASKMSLSGGIYTVLKSAKLQNVAGSGYFDGAIDENHKTTHKVTWNADAISEEAALNVPSLITDESVTAWSESSDNQYSASGTFTLTNSKEELELTGVTGFKSVKISGAIGKTVVDGVTGEDTSSNKTTQDLSVKGTKGTYSSSSTSSSKAATTLEITKATLGEGAFDDLKSVKATEVAGSANFTASLDTESKDNLKAEWKADEITVAELAVLLAEHNPDNEAITSVNETSESKTSVVGTLTLSNSSSDAVLEGLSAVNFKTVDLTFTDDVEGSLDTAMNSNSKYSWKRTASGSKITDEISNTWTKSSVASLKVTGKKADPAVITLAGEEEGVMAYSSVTLTDAVLDGEETSIKAYDENYNRKVSQSYSSDSDETTYKLDKTYNQTGKGTFTASISGDAAAAFNGTLYGFKSVTLKDKVSIGNVNNTKYVGSEDSTLVPFTEEYDPMAEEPEGMTEILGNVNGSYTRSKNGDVSAKWNGVYSTTASGTFTQTATVAGITAGEIIGYDKVTLDGVASAGALDGSNEKMTTVATYKYTKGDTETDTKVITTEWTASSSATVSGRKFSGSMQTASVEGIFGYKTVTIEDTAVSGAITVANSKTIETFDGVNYFDHTVEETITAVGTLTATNSSIGGVIAGFQTVKLSNTVTEGESVSGGNEKSLWKQHEEEDWFLSNGEKTATGSFTAEAKQGETEYAVGDVSGYQKVMLTNYSAGVVSAGFYESELENAVSATYVKKTDANEDKDIPASWQKAAKTKNNTFTATASSFKEDAATVSIGGVTGYAKVEATNLASIGSIDNAVITAYSPANTKEEPAFVAHYGDWTASSTEEEDAYTSVKVTAGTSVTISGQKTLATAVTGNVAGYAKITMDKVELGGEAPVLYAAGDYTYTAKADKKDIVTETESNKSNGTLQITNATAVDGTVISMTGFKTISADIDGAVTIDKIIGGNNEYKYVDGDLESFTSTLAGSVDLTTAEGVVTGLVNGFESVTFTDTNFDGEAARIMGHDRNAKGQYAAKTTITFIDNENDGQTISGTIVDAKEIVFKSKADEDVDFIISGLVDSWLGNDTKISFVKSQAEVDLSKFQLDEGDTIDLSSGSAINLSGELSDLAAYFKQMSGSEFTGSGTIAFSGVTTDEVKAALDNADIKYAKTIKFAELA